MNIQNISKYRKYTAPNSNNSYSYAVNDDVNNGIFNNNNNITNNNNHHHHQLNNNNNHTYHHQQLQQQQPIKQNQPLYSSPQQGQPPILPDQSHYQFKIYRPWYPDQSIENNENILNNAMTTTTTTTTNNNPVASSFTNEDIGDHLTKKLYNMDIHNFGLTNHYQLPSAPKQKDVGGDQQDEKEQLGFLKTMFPEIDDETLEFMLNECNGDLQKIVDTLLEPLNFEVDHNDTHLYEDPNLSIDQLDLDHHTTTTTNTNKKPSKKPINEPKLHVKISPNPPKQQPSPNKKQQNNQQKQNNTKQPSSNNKQQQPKQTQTSTTKTNDSPSISVQSNEKPLTNQQKKSVAQQNETYRELLSTLQEMFGHVSRPNLAMVLDQNNFDLEKSIEQLLTFDEESYKQQLNIQHQIEQQQQQQKQQKQQQQQQKTTSNNLGNIIKEQEKDAIENPTPVYKYVSTKSAPSPVVNSFASLENNEHNFDELNASIIIDNKYKKSDKAKLNKLYARFNYMTSEEIIEDVYEQSGRNLQGTWKILTEMFPVDTRSLATKIRNNKSLQQQQEQHKQQQQQQQFSSTADLLKSTHSPGDSSPVEDPNRLNILSSPPQNVAIFDIQKDLDTRPITVGNEHNKKKAPRVKVHELNAKDYNEYRREASRYSVLRNTFFQQASQAYMKGNSAEARNLAAKGQYYAKLVKEANEGAANQIFMSCNSRINDTLKIDLHGLHVTEALEMVSKILDIHTRGEYEGDTGPGPKKVDIITGLGNHSQGGAKIKPALISFLKECRLPFDDCGGLLTVYINQ